MSRTCILCEKGPSAGRNVSHSRRRTVRRFLPNVQKKSFVFRGEKYRGYVCTTCMKRYKAELICR